MQQPRRTPGGPKKFVVKACQGGTEKVIRFGDPNMKIKSPTRSAANLCARHKCDSKPPRKLTARYWSCKKW